jgi:hypothetical protein
LPVGRGAGRRGTVVCQVCLLASRSLAATGAIAPQNKTPEGKPGNEPEENSRESDGLQLTAVSFLLASPAVRPCSGLKGVYCKSCGGTIGGGSGGNATPLRTAGEQTEPGSNNELYYPKLRRSRENLHKKIRLEFKTDFLLGGLGCTATF